MTEPLAGKVLRKIGEARELDHRLILMVGPAGSWKTSALNEVSISTSVPLVNVNLGPPRRMLDLVEPVPAPGPQLFSSDDAALAPGWMSRLRRIGVPARR